MIVKDTDVEDGGRQKTTRMTCTEMEWRQTDEVQQQWWSRTDTAGADS